jgi:hypothetical protein
MTWAWEVGSPPTTYRDCSFPNNRAGIFYVGQTPVITLSSGAAASTTYVVRDYYGNTVSSGSVTTSATTVTPTAPVGGWPCGWYRLYLTGTGSASGYGNSAGATSFVVIRSDAHFPPAPAVAVAGYGGNEARSTVTKSILGMAPGRMLIADASAPTTTVDSIANVQTDVGVAKTYWSAPASQYVDPVRTRKLWTNFPNGAYDRLQLKRTGDNVAVVNVYCATESIDGSTIFIAVAAGTSTGKKVTVATPTSGTVVETYDNVTSWQTFQDQVNAVSTRIKAFFTGATGDPVNSSAAAIGRSFYNGVVTTVSTLYPDIAYYEGPSNEPPLSGSGSPGPEVTHQMRLFAAAVHAGNASAKAIGPCPVDITTTGWRNFLAAGGGTYCDAISFHDYNSVTNGNLSQGRQHLTRFKALLAEYGLSSKELWQTEAGAALTPVYGVHHPRRARVKMMHTLLWEQFGLARERNTYWYDQSHGFWSFPAWWQNGDTSLTPDAPLHRTLAEETFGKTHAAALDLGTLGNNMFLASRYDAPGGSKVIVQMASSYIPSASITYTIAGTTAALEVVDAWGNLTNVAQVNGTVTVPAAEIPTYLRLPTGVTATVHHINDWPSTTATTVAGNAAGTVSTTGVYARSINDGAFPVDYSFAAGTVATTPALPDGFIIANPAGMRVDRAVIWCPPAWQTGTTLLDFDIQSSNNGTSWTTQATVTKTTPTSLSHGTNANNAGCQRETFWDEQWIFDVKLPAPVTANYFRLWVRTVSNGGEPDAASVTVGGQGGSATTAQVLDVALVCDDNQIVQAAIVA